MSEFCRLDKWLWYTRVVKSRTLAGTLIAGGKVRVNRERVSKSSQTVRQGDVITATVAKKVRVLKVVELGRRRGPASEAQGLYEDLTPVEVASHIEALHATHTLTKCLPLLSKICFMLGTASIKPVCTNRCESKYATTGMLKPSPMAEARSEKSALGSDFL